MAPPRRNTGPKLRCRDLGEYPDCLFLIDGEDRQVLIDRLRVHLRDAHGVTQAGFARRRRAAEERLNCLSPRSQEE